MKMVQVEMVVYYEAQDSTTVEEVKDVVVDMAEMNGLNVRFSKAELIWNKPDVEIDDKMASDRGEMERHLIISNALKSNEV